MRLRRFKYTTSTDLSRAMTQPVLRSAPTMRKPLLRDERNYMRDPRSGQRDINLEVAAAGANAKVFNAMSSGLMQLHNTLAAAEAETSATNALYKHKMKGLEVVADLKSQALSQTITTTDTLGVTHETQAPTYPSVVGNYNTSMRNHRTELAATLPRAVRSSFNNAAMAVDAALAKEANNIQLKKQMEWISFQAQDAYLNAKDFKAVDKLDQNQTFHFVLGGATVATMSANRKRQIALDSIGADINAAWGSERELNKIASFFSFPDHVFEEDWFPDDFGDNGHADQDRAHGLSTSQPGGKDKSFAIWNIFKGVDRWGKLSLRDVLSNLQAADMDALRTKIEGRIDNLKKINDEEVENKVNSYALQIATADEARFVSLSAGHNNWLLNNPDVTPAQQETLKKVLQQRNQGPLFDDQRDYARVRDSLVDYTVGEIVMETGLTWATRADLIEKREGIERSGMLWSSQSNQFSSAGYEAAQKLKRHHDVLDVVDSPLSLRYMPNAQREEKLQKIKNYNQKYDELEKHLNTLDPHLRPLAARKWVNDYIDGVSKSDVVTPILPREVKGYALSSDPEVNAQMFEQYVIDASGGTLTKDQLLKLPKGAYRTLFIDAAKGFGVDLEYPGTTEDDDSLQEWLAKGRGTADEWFSYYKAAIRARD